MVLLAGMEEEGGRERESNIQNIKDSSILALQSHDWGGAHSLCSVSIIVLNNI